MSDPTRDDSVMHKKEVVLRFSQSKFEDLLDSYSRMVRHFSRLFGVLIVGFHFQNVNLQEKIMDIIDKSLLRDGHFDTTNESIDSPVTVGQLTALA